MKIKTLLCILLCISVTCRSVDIGSDTAVTRFNAQQLIQDGDRVAGFAWLTGGFLVGGHTVDWTFDSVFPVDGPLAMAFGTMSLNQDLVMANNGTLQHMGNINGNNHIFELAQSADCIPAESGGAVGCSITFTAQQDYSNTVNSVDFSFDSLYITAGTNAGGGVNELHVAEIVNEGAITPRASAALGKTIFSVAWHPSKDYIAVGADSGTGDELFTYTFNRSANTLTLIDSISLGGVGNTVNEVAWNPDGDRLAAATDVNAGELRVYVINANGTFGTSITVDTTPDANAVDWNKTGQYLLVGFDASGTSDELRVYTFTKGSPDTLVLNASFDGGRQINAVSWNKAVDSNGELVIGAQTGTDRARVFRHNPGAGTLTPIDGDGGTAVNAINWHIDGRCIAAGLQNNSEGSGGELRIYGFVDEILDLEDDNEIGQDVLTVRWSPNGRLLAMGDNNLGGAIPSVQLYHLDSKVIDTSRVTFDNVNIICNGNVTFNAPAIVFTGESSIDGEDHLISFSPTFSIEIASNSSLLLKDMTLSGLSGKNLSLVDSTSTITFQNVEILLNDTYTMDKGHFEVIQSMYILGGGTFVYQSSESSIITSRVPAPPMSLNGLDECQPGSCGHLIIKNGSTFNYDVISSFTLLQLEGGMASFKLDSGNLQITESLELTKGAFMVQGRSTISAGNSISFGDGIPANNCNIRIGSQLEVTGNLINNNV